MIVSVFIAGVQKGGTTALFSYLNEHPGLSGPFQKEPHFFDDEGRDWRAIDRDRYHSCFPEPEQGRIRFEATPIYLYWPPSLERLKAYNPDARLIFLFRDPIERAYSNWRMERLRGRETLPFARAIREGRSRLPAHDRGHANWRTFAYVERGFYGSQLERALSLFPPDQMLLLESRHLRHDHVRTLDKIARFLGIGRFPPTGLKIENRTQAALHLEAISRDDHAYLQDQFRLEMATFQARSGIDVRSWPVSNPFVPTEAG